MITATNLTKRYGSVTVVDDVTFTARAGRITGFLGANGAGKSTTLKMLTGMTPITSGTATVLGQPYASLTNPGRQVGVLLDAAAQHSGRTGRESLTLAAILMGVPKSRVAEVLDLVHLDTRAARKRVGAYSLGMRQRLGIAAALLGDPQVLVLDEPANGLDPAGIRWMRTLLRDFADGGGTVLLSSHLLHEVQLVADDVVVIDSGRIVATGEVADFTGDGARSLEDVFFTLTGGDHRATA
ncbi:MAG: ATP-binding cassette domain-containing protein [Dermatophilus congolensis]|nr:ATP-binding cassette domain-containing protein [Dermatophilus congolensis]